MTALITCPACDGLGEWDEMQYATSPVQISPDYKRIVCDACEGKGEIKFVPACLHCEYGLDAKAYCERCNEHYAIVGTTVRSLGDDWHRVEAA